MQCIVYNRYTQTGHHKHRQGPRTDQDNKNTVQRWPLFLNKREIYWLYIRSTGEGGGLLWFSLDKQYASEIILQRGLCLCVFEQIHYMIFKLTRTKQTL